MDKDTINQFIAEIDALRERLYDAVDRLEMDSPEERAWSCLGSARYSLREALNRLDPVQVLDPTSWNPRWTVTTVPVGRLDGHDIAERAKAAVEATDGIVWDPESGQFFAYTDTEEQARRLAEVVEGVVRAEYARS